MPYDLVLILLLLLFWTYSPRLLSLKMVNNPVIFLTATIPSYVVAFTLMTIILGLDLIHRIISTVLQTLIHWLIKLTESFRDGIFGK